MPFKLRFTAQDRKRIYLTGFSMGDAETWMLAMAAPERFTAITPICGSGIYWNATSVKDIPVFMYHGDWGVASICLKQ